MTKSWYEGWAERFFRLIRTKHATQSIFSNYYRPF